MSVQRDLIFDIGLHEGRDAAWYLAKGFRVVGVEAIPGLARAAADHCSEFAERLAVVPKALYEHARTRSGVLPQT